MLIEALKPIRHSGNRIAVGQVADLDKIDAAPLIAVGAARITKHAATVSIVVKTKQSVGKTVGDLVMQQTKKTAKKSGMKAAAATLHKAHASGAKIEPLTKPS